jgi:hypothetical protein
MFDMTLYSIPFFASHSARLNRDRALQRRTDLSDSTERPAASEAKWAVPQGRGGPLCELRAEDLLNDVQTKSTQNCGAFGSATRGSFSSRIAV